MDLSVKFNSQKLICQPKLVASKSESNRALIMSFLSEGQIDIENLSESGDSRILQKALMNIAKNIKIIDVEDCGTAFRFLTAVLAITPGEWVLTGAERMKKRPIGAMVDALRSQGASIEFLQENGFPPLKIVGAKIHGGQLSIKSNQSSQFVSGLMLVASRLSSGLTILFKGSVVSKPYIEMTAKMMINAGIEVRNLDNAVSVMSGNYQKSTLKISGDWSAASYWYCIAAMSNNCKILLSNISRNGLQGDEKCVEIFKNFGVQTEIIDNSIMLTKSNFNYSEININCADYPDLVPAIAVTMAALDFEGIISGIENLKIKESDRIFVIAEQLSALGFNVSHSNNYIQIHKSGIQKLNNIIVKTYNDHRIAMAFATLATKFNCVRIENAQVVKKSYPNFWIDMEEAGFILERI